MNGSWLHAEAHSDTMMGMYFLLAMLWLVGGVCWLVFDALHPESVYLRLPGTNFSAGWMAFLFAAYNLLRWWSGRATRRRQLHWRPRRAVNGERMPEEPNPDFDFSDLRRTERGKENGRK